MVYFNRNAAVGRVHPGHRENLGSAKPLRATRITIRQASSLPVSLTELAQQRFAFALGRFGTRVQSLSVRMRDLNGPRGGADKRCTVALRLNGSPRAIVVQETDADTAAAVDAAHDWRPRRDRREP
jgi:putative sigma-54 modulation protein